MYKLTLNVLLPGLTLLINFAHLGVHQRNLPAAVVGEAAGGSAVSRGSSDHRKESPATLGRFAHLRIHQRKLHAVVVGEAAGVALLQR